MVYYINCSILRLKAFELPKILSFSCFALLKCFIFKNTKINIHKVKCIVKYNYLSYVFWSNEILRGSKQNIPSE